MKDLKPEIGAILAKYGDSELGIYRLQKLFEVNAQEYHKQKVEIWDQPARAANSLLNMYDAQADPCQGAANPVLIKFKSKL